MPTGYTVKVQSGEITDFAKFAMDCARAFGACITMRDDPSGTPIPEKFMPSTYHTECLVDAESDLALLLAMTEDEKIAAEEADYVKAVIRYDERKAEAKLHRERYETMLTKVNSWKIPESHAELRRFMLQQLRTSIDHDCYTDYMEVPKSQTAAAWYADKLARVQRDIAYHTEEQAKEITRTLERNEWLAALRTSLVS